MTTSRTLIATDANLIEAPRRQRKSVAGRKLMRWDPSHDQLVLLYIEYISVVKSIPIPWDEVAAHLNNFTTGEGIKQHLAKVRIAREAHGQPIPPRIGGRKKTEPAVTEGEPKKKTDISKRSGLLYYSDDKNIKQTSSSEGHSVMRRGTSTTNAVKKKSNTVKAVGREMTAVRKTKPGIEPQDHPKEINRGKKRSRGNALAKEVQELTATQEGGPLKKQMTTKLRAREPVDYSDMELQEDHRINGKYYTYMQEQPCLNIEHGQQVIQHSDRLNSAAADISSPGYTEQMAHSQSSMGSHFREPESGRLESNKASAPHFSPSPGTLPLSGYPHIPLSTFPEYDIALPAHDSSRVSTGHTQRDTMPTHELKVNYNNHEPPNTSARGYGTGSTYGNVNRSPLGRIEDSTSTDSNQLLRKNDLQKLESPQAVTHMPLSQVKAVWPPQHMSSKSLIGPLASIPAATKIAFMHGPMISGWADEPVKTMFKPRFPATRSPIDLRPQSAIGPFSIHVDPYLASPDFTQIVVQQEAGFVPLKGEAPGVSSAHSMDTAPASHPTDTDSGPYEKRMQSWQGLKAHVADHKDSFDANTAPSQALPLSHSYHEDQDLLGFNVRDIYPLEDTEENTEDVGDAYEEENHDDGAVSVGGSAEWSDGETDANMIDEDVFDQFVNFKPEQSDSDPNTMMLDDQFNQFLEPLDDNESNQSVDIFF